MSTKPAQPGESVPDRPADTTYSSVRYGSLPRRLGALVYDALAVAALWFGATALVLALVTRGEAVPPGNVYYLLFLTGVALAYFIVSWRRAGQTLGLRAWGLVLLADGGGRPDFAALLVRAAVGTLSLAGLGIGYLWALARTDRRAWHDLASGTHLERRR